MAFPRGAMDLSAVCDCGISCSYSLAIFNEIPAMTFQDINESKMLWPDDGWTRALMHNYTK